MDALALTNLRKTYGPLAAVDDLTFSVPRGETFALLGPNGAGKSTAIEICEGHRRATSGEVRILGQDPAHPTPAWLAKIGIVLQSGSLPDTATVAELIRHHAGFYPNPLAPDDVIDAVGLTSKAGSRLSKLSGGQRRRVDVALGIIGRPELLFLDEPTTGFDPEARREFWGLIRSLGDDGTTIVLTTHYLDEAEHLADRAGVIAAGRLVYLGSLSELGATHTSTVTWTDAAGRHHAHSTQSPARFIREHFTTEPHDLTVTKPTLEERYLTLIGAVA